MRIVPKKMYAIAGTDCEVTRFNTVTIPLSTPCNVLPCNRLIESLWSYHWLCAIPELTRLRSGRQQRHLTGT